MAAMNGQGADLSRRPKILHVIGGVGPGGAETMMYRLVTQSPGLEHQVICLNEPDWYSECLADRGIRVDYLGMTGNRRALSGLWRLWHLLRRSDADVIQGWMYRSNLLASLLGTSGIPVVWGIHCSSLEPLRVGARLWVYASGLVAGWLPAHIVNCSIRSAQLHQRLGFGRAPGTVIHNGYDASQFFPDTNERNAMREKLGIDPETFLVGSIARWHRQKAIPNLLRGVRIASQMGIPIKCLLIGHELDRSNEDLLRLIHAEGVSDLVIPLGRRRDIPDLARAMDLHILASSGGEAFPNSVAETMLSGTPNLVTDVGDCAYMVDGAGWVVSPADSSGLGKAIGDAQAMWQGRPREWQARGEAARARIADNFSMTRMIEEYEKIWRSLLAFA